MRIYHATMNGARFTSHGDCTINTIFCTIENPEDFLTEYMEPRLKTILRGDDFYEEAKEIVGLCLAAEKSGENDIEPSEEAQEYIENVLVNPDPANFE